MEDEESVEEGRSRPFEERQFKLSLGTGLALGLSDVEERSLDTVGVDQSFFRWNFSVAPSYRVAPSWALGARGSWSSDAGARGTVARSFWQAAAEARYQPAGLLGPYVALDAGLAWAVDQVGSASASQSAPLLGGALGYDIGLAEPLSLGVELRGGVAFFGAEGASLRGYTESTRYVYGTSPWVSLNVTGNLCF